MNLSPKLYSIKSKAVGKEKNRTTIRIYTDAKSTAKETASRARQLAMKQREKPCKL